MLERRDLRGVRDARHENSRRANVVADVDQQVREIAGAPQHAGEHDQPAGLAEQRRNRRRALRVHAGRHFGDQQQHQDHRHEAEQLRQVSQPGVRLDVARRAPL